MPGIRPILVCSDVQIAEDLQFQVKQSCGQTLVHRTYTDCRQHVVWHHPGLLVLVAARSEDWAGMIGLARECALRRSPLSVVIVREAMDDDDGTLSEIALPTVRLVSRSGASAAIHDLLRRLPSVGNSVSSADVLASRLMSMTPSLAPQAGRLELAAAHDLTVLLTGETGTGKTFLGRLLHDHSPRRHHPFLMVPCGAQPANLFESCFFGHVKGSFTGAHQTQKGKFAAAGQGTILLDEIDSLGLEQQASLLRVIETGEYEPVGSHETLRCEARIIAASNWNLEEAVADGRFRRDLYYRLNVLPFHLLPLRERRQDIEILARGFAAHFSSRFNKGLTDINPDALGLLAAFPWPGNIRQLENVIQQAVLVSCGPDLTVHDLPDVVRQYTTAETLREFSVPPSLRAQTAPGGTVAIADHRPNNSLLQNRADYERRLIHRTLVECNFNRSSAARALKISRVTLHKKIKQYGLKNLSASDADM